MVTTLLLAPASASAVPPPAQIAMSGDPVLYTTRAGDNLYVLAQRYFIRIEDYIRVQRLNRVLDPYRLPVGRILRIPRAMLRYEPMAATVIACRGRIEVRSGNQVRTARQGSMVTEGDRIFTAENSFITLRLPDRSVVSLPSRSAIGVRRLRRILLTGGIERLFMLEKGQVLESVTPAQNADDSFRVYTPVAVSAVRGTEFRVRYDPDNARAVTEVLKGRVDVAAREAAAAALTVPAGFGTIATVNGTTGTSALPPAPLLRQPDRVQDDPRLRFEITPLENASAYHLQIASDAGFLDMVEEITVPTASASLPSIPDGIWFVRATAIDAKGIEGRPSTYSFQRRLQHIETALDRRRAGRYREYLFRWIVEGTGIRQYRFQLMKDHPDATPTVDEAGLGTDRFVITDLPPGTYYWRVMSLQFVEGAAYPKWSPVERLIVTRNE